MDSYSRMFLNNTVKIANKIDTEQIESIAVILSEIRKEGGRLFILGVGGGAGNAAHAVNDFRKICGIETYSPTDNVSELTARVNDEGWETVFAKWLITSKLGPKDCVLVFSVGGGNEEKGISINIVRALKLAKEVGAKITGIVGRDGGFTAKTADACVIVPSIDTKNITPHTEAFQAVVWHLLVSHPLLKTSPMKWESVK